MKSKAEELESVEKSIIALDNHFKNMQLDSATITRFQTALDKTAEKIQYDENLGSKRFRLYEMQALIEIAKGNFSRANSFINDARTMMESDDSFVSNVLDEYIYNNTNSVDNQQSEVEEGSSTKKFSRKLEGWLALYTLRLVAIPFFFVYDAISVSSSDATSISDNWMVFLNTIIFTDVVIAGFALVIWFYYFPKKKVTRSLTMILESILAVYYIFLTIWIASLSSQANVDMGDTGAKFFWYGLIAVVWAVYWNKSKRAKATFTKS